MRSILRFSSFLKLLLARPVLRVETLALLFALFFLCASNGLFWRTVFSGRDLADMATWRFAVALFVALGAFHLVLFLLFLTRWSARPLLMLLVICTAFASYYMSTFTVFLDPGMLRNVLRTDIHEAGELLTPAMVPHLLFHALLPAAFLVRVRIVRDPLLRALRRRLFVLAAAALVAFAALLVIFHEVAPLMRNNKEIRYLITPGNYLYSLVRVLGADARTAVKKREPIGVDAALAPSWKARSRPVLFVIVVGETARTANWGLSGYARQTTPALSALDVINFSQVTSCGTNTEVSLPCMFSLYGRRHYDEDKIRNSESLLNILQRSGMKVIWRDNQSGCKGVCEGVEEQKLGNAKVSPWCDGDRCLDEILLHGLDGLLADAQGNLVLVLHQLGNHGPAYFKRYPPEFRRFEPVCETGDLSKCSRESVVNAYDNALLYTDHMLAQTIAFLKQQADRFDTALIYVSDHGESLGENGLYLHGIPYAIAPRVQKEVPMVMWFSPGYSRNLGLDTMCLRQRASKSASHDHLFHSVLGLLDVSTQIYDASLDLSAGCRAASLPRPGVAP